MRTGPLLAAAVADPTLAGRLAAARDRLRTRLDRDEAIAAARAAVALNAGDDAETVTARAETLLAEPGWRRRLLALLSEAVRDETLLDLPMTATSGPAQSALVLLAGEGATVSLVRLRLPPRPPEDAPVQLGGSVTLLRPLRPTDATGRLWRAAPVTPTFTVAGAPPLRGGAPVALAEGRTLRVDGRREALGALAGGGALVMLRAVVHAGRSPFARVYDPASGRLLSVAATDEAGSRMAVAASLLGAIGRAEDAEAASALLDEEDFSLRWLGARIAASLDRRAGAAALARLRDDVHPEVRAAARAA